MCVRALITREILRSKGAQWYAVLMNCRRAKKVSELKPAGKEKAPCFDVRALIAREIMRSKDAQCNTKE